MDVLLYQYRYTCNLPVYFMAYGVGTAKRGWAEKKDVLNTLGYNVDEEVKWRKQKLTHLNQHLTSSHR
jgi:hypothetical protein